jgi:hypothetical protein
MPPSGDHAMRPIQPIWPFSVLTSLTADSPLLTDFFVLVELFLDLFVVMRNYIRLFAK